MFAWEASVAVMAPPAVGRGDTSLCAQRSRTCERNGNEPQPVAPVTRQNGMRKRVQK